MDISETALLVLLVPNFGIRKNTKITMLITSNTQKLM